ncbi:MAG: hypothetical protein M1816_007486 [Peltula sp. TS41687]|nr:MAG: hypothetical protein M1816_007486 [Peltula sp. TS41687]
MSEAYERERQNHSRLDELSSKVSALRGVTIDIYDNARSQEVIDHSTSDYTHICQTSSMLAKPRTPPQNEVFSNFSSSVKSSAGRLGRMASSGNRVQVFKLAGVLVASVVLLWWVWGLLV